MSFDSGYQSYYHNTGNGWVDFWGNLTRGMGDTWNDLNGTTANNVFNHNEAVDQRNWETMMSNTAYQRAVGDMEAAGLNPASLGQAGGASPASTPSGAAARADGNGSRGFLGVIGDICATALKAKLFKSLYSGKNPGEVYGITKKALDGSSSAMKALKSSYPAVRYDAKTASGKKFLSSLGYSAKDLYQDWAR